jgi:ribonuclease D
MKKTLQKCDWTVRPLSSEQMQYAAIDAHYLPYLWNLLSREAASTLSPDELTKLQQRWSKPRQYKRECNHRAYFLKKVENIFEEVLEDFDDYYHTEAYT